MKIALINNLYFPYDKGGAEKIVEKQIIKLKKAGHQVFLITSKPKKNKEINDQEKIYYINSNYYNLDKIPKFLRLFWHLNQFLKFKTNRKIKKILINEKPEIVISHNIIGLSWQIPKILNKLNIKHIHYLHDIQLLHPSGLMLLNKEKLINTKLAKLYQSITRKIFQKTDKVISPSKWLLNLHLKKDFFKTSKLEHKLNYQIESINISWPKNLKNFLFIGQLEKHKGILFLIKFFQDNPQFNLTVVGDGSLRQKLIKISNEYKNINYLGKLKKEAVLLQLKNHDCLIVPSLCYENSPTVIFEAISQNTPVIASDIGGITELKDIFNLRLFKANDSRSLIEEIIKN
jgi:glycosyltransferase involved in cell wall biosynthesis